MPSAPPRSPIPQLARLDLVFDTARLRLRPLTDADVDDLWPIVSDPAFPKQMSWEAHKDPSETRAFIARMAEELAANTAVMWGIEHEGRAVGAIGLHGITFQLAAWRVDRAELGFWLSPALHGRGLVTEAATAVIRAGFEQIGLHKVTVGCFATNEASRRVIEKLGFRFVGKLEEDVWRDGAWHAHLRYEMTAPEWPDVHTTMRIDRRSLDQ